VIIADMDRRERETFADVVAQVRSEPAALYRGFIGRTSNAARWVDPAGREYSRVTEKRQPEEARALAARGATVVYDAWGCGGSECTLDWLCLTRMSGSSLLRGCRHSSRARMDSLVLPSGAPPTAMCSSKSLSTPLWEIASPVRTPPRRGRPRRLRRATYGSICAADKSLIASRLPHRSTDIACTETCRRQRSRFVTEVPARVQLLVDCGWTDRNGPIGSKVQTARCTR
jgi:hypothetical protein